MYSALKVNGKKLYELARQGVEVERKARTITVEEIRIDHMELPEVTITVTCSKGTYIRTLCHDIGQALGCGGCMKSLLRTRVGIFELEDSITLAEIEQMRDEGTLEQHIYAVDSVFGAYPKAVLQEEALRLVRNGNPLAKNMLDIQAPQEGMLVRLYDDQENFLAVYAWNKDRRSYRAEKMFL